MIKWFLNNPVAANILVIAMVLGGLISLQGMRAETFPSFDPRLISISVVYPGATPYEIADSITIRIENSVLGIDGIKQVKSTALEGYAAVNISLDAYADPDYVYNEIETAVNGLSKFPPEGAEKIVIKRLKPTSNVMTLVLHGDVNEPALRYWAKLIDDELRLLPSIGLTNVRGIREPQISIEISEESLQKHGITLSEIGQAIRNFSQDIPAGILETQKGDILLRVEGKRHSGKDFASIIVKVLPDGSNLSLSDIAKIDDGLEDRNIISRFNGQRAAFIDVQRSDSDDALLIAKAVNKYIEGVELPRGLSLEVREDDTINLRDRISLMMRNGIVGFCLVFCILLLFLDLKLAFWTSAAIPISFLGGLMVLYFLGYSINMITLFGLIVTLGILVDDSVIIGESIFQSQERTPNDPNAVYNGVISVYQPVFVGVATTICAFAPLLLGSNTVLGQLIQFIPAVVITVLLVSLIEAFFILPNHLANANRWNKGIMSDVRNNVAYNLKLFILNRLLPFAAIAMKWRYATIAFFIAIFIITLSLVSSGFIRFVFFPNVEGDKVIVNVEMPQGTSFNSTKAVMLEIEQYILSIRDRHDKELDKGESYFESISVSVGEQYVQDGPGGNGVRNAGSNTNNVGQIVIKILPSGFRPFSALDIDQELRDKISAIPGIEKLTIQSALIQKLADINIELSHPDPQKLSTAASWLQSELTKVSGVNNIENSFKEGKAEYVFVLTREGIASGLTPTMLGTQLRASYLGLEVQRFYRDDAEVLVYVRYPKSIRNDSNILDNTRIRLPNGEEVALRTVASIEERQGYAQIDTVDGKRVVSVTADVDTRVSTPNVAIDSISEEVFPELSKQFPRINYSFAGETREQREDMAFLGKNMLIAMLLIYVLLGAQLRSYILPFVIMSAIPFGVVGAILGHLILGYDLTFISMFGVVALTGVVVNDSVVLMDYFNKMLVEGKTMQESALMAIEQRFRPILLTTLSTSLGLLPMLLETSLQAQFLIPMVVSLFCGLIFATVVILIFVPALTLAFNDIKEKMRHMVSLIN